MRKSIWKKTLVATLSLATVLGSFSAFSGNLAQAAEENGTEITKILEAKDIEIRAKYDDKSNIGESRQVSLSDGSKITVKDNGIMREELTSQQLADEYMGNGINLGNTLEAPMLVENKKNDVERTVYDTAWGNAVTTREYIDLVHSYGFNTLRIPIAWTNGDIDDGNYNIKGALLDRVEEVVNYALDNGMYVVINDHWDNQWWGQFGACKKDENGEKVADEEVRAAAWERYEKYWTQIAERFKGYSDHLIFEGANEELGDRLNDGICVNGPAKGYCKPDNATKDIVTVSGNLTTNELYETVNKINQKFVDTIRTTGGNNEKRHLLIPGYNTNFQNTADARFKMPTDTQVNGNDKLFLSVHYYTPGGFCLDNPDGEYTTADQQATPKYFTDLKKFADAGYGIILGEFSVCEPSSVSSSVTQWLYDVYKECVKYHIVPVLWDNGAYFDRKALKMNYKDIAIFFNTINQTSGDESMTRVTGGAVKPEKEESTFPAYLDKEIWEAKGIHAYMMYQTATWEYRNEYKPLSKLAANKHSWEYASASGAELTNKTKVQDVLITKDGTYTVGYDGIDLSGANTFKMLGVAMDVDRKVYNDLGIKVSDAVITFDDKEQTLDFNELTWKADNPYMTYMAINSWDPDKAKYPLGVANENEAFSLPQKSMYITFTVTGLDKIFKEMEAGTYVDPETGKTYKELYDPEPETTPVPTPVPTPGSNNSSVVGPAKGQSFATGDFAYKVTKSATTKVNGEVEVTGIGTKGATKIALSLGDVVEFSKGKFTVTSIADGAFKNAAKLKSIKINSKSVKTIPANAFSGCKKLSTVTAKYITEIKGSAFKSCKTLAKITLGKKLTSVAKNAFKGCKKKISVKGGSKKIRKANIKKLKKSGYKKFK